MFSGNKAKLSVARAGNVIGGGDWSEEGGTDCIKSWSKRKK